MRVWIFSTLGCMLCDRKIRSELVRDTVSEVMGHVDHTSIPAVDDRWNLVQRIVSSRHLVKAPQLREILLYISRRSLTENVAAISEQEIGCKALGRRPDFNPNEDNIVRVQVRHLRRKLEEYFASEGVAEPLLMTIPKGGYVPRFEPRVECIGAEEATALPPAGHAAARTGTRVGWRFVALAVFLALLGFSAALAWKRPAMLRSASATIAQAGRADSVWSRIFAPGQKTDIVLADSCLVAVQDILDTDVPLSDYLSKAYPDKLIQTVPDPKLRAALQLLAARQYTSLGDASLASKLMEISRRYTAQTNIRYSRFLSVREFKTGNFILIGSRRGIPFEELFEPQLNFSMEQDRARHVYLVRNRAPHAGEPHTFESSVAKDGDTYADIALLPNLAGTGSVLILSGIDMAGTEAAGELVASPEFSELLVKMLGPRTGPAPPSYIEMLMQAKVVAGATQSPKIVAYRLVPGRSLSAGPSTGGADIE
jgi:hypothetical protein